MKIFNFRNHRGLIFTESFPAELVQCLVPASTDKGTYTKSNYIQAMSFCSEGPPAHARSCSGRLRWYSSVECCLTIISQQWPQLRSPINIIFRQGACHRQLWGGPSRTTEAQFGIAHPPSSFVSFVWAAGFSSVLPPSLNMTTSAFSKPSLHMFYTTKSYLLGRRVTVL
jgi:hypothetical protein